MYLFRKHCGVCLVVFLVVAPFVAIADDDPPATYDVVTTKDYVDMTTVSKYQGEATITTNADYHQYDIMQVDSTGSLARVTPSATPTSGSSVPITSGAVYTALAAKEDVSNKLNGGTGNTVVAYSTDTDKYPSAKAVYDYAVQKPSTVAEGKVLTYGASATVNSQPEAQYVKVPVATGDPNAVSNPATPTAFASIWLQ